MYIRFLFRFLISSLLLIATSKAMDSIRENESPNFLKVIEHYQQLIHAEIDFNTRMLSSLKEVIADSSFTLKDDENFQYFFPVGYDIYTKSSALHGEIIKGLIVNLQNDLIFAHYLNQAFQDIGCCLENGAQTTESPVFKDHLKEIICDVAWQSELSCIEVNKAVLGYLHNHFDVDITPTINGGRKLEESISYSDDPRQRAACRLLYLVIDDDLPRSQCVSDEFWQDIDLITPEGSVYFDHQQQYLYFYSCLEHDLLPFTHRFPKSFFQHLKSVKFEQTLGNRVLGFAKSKTSDKDNALTRRSDQSYPLASSDIERYFLSENEIFRFLEESYKKLETKPNVHALEPKLDAHADDSFLPDHIKRMSVRQQAQARKNKRIQQKALAKKQSCRLPDQENALDAALSLSVLSPHPQVIEKEELIAVKAQTSAPLSPPIKERAHLIKPIAAKVQLMPMPIPNLSKKGSRFYDAIFSNGTKNVCKQHFNQFLKDVGGKKYKMTPQGLREVDLQDKTVEIHYCVPNLTPQQTGSINFKIHQPHANYPFPKRTLYHFLRPQLEEAGYGVDLHKGT